jgi:hypothetical protein
VSYNIYMLKRIALISGLFLLINLPAAAETGYSSVIEDLPLMTGMVERPEDTVVFDKPAGRIIEINATAVAMPEAIEKFYDETLPPLGWKTAGPLKFIRENETLKISIEQMEGGSLVHFSLTPGSKGK